MFRKIVAGVAIAGFLAFSIVGCATGAGGGVTLASAQAEAQAILTGVQQAALVYETSPNANPVVVKQLQTDIVALTTAVDAFKSVTGTSASQVAQTVVQAVGVAVMAIPMDPATKAAIDLGLAVLDAFVGGIAPPAGVPAAAPTNPVTSAANAIFGQEVVQPPVPIPAPQYAPVR